MVVMMMTTTRMMTHRHPHPCTRLARQLTVLCRCQQMTGWRRRRRRRGPGPAPRIRSLRR
jgi:hypothetical protein